MNEAGGGKILFQGEEFYTITALPLYYHRREWLLKNILSEIGDRTDFKLLDFGCGDGMYSIKLKLHLPSPQSVIEGCDLSSTMIETAKKAVESAGISVALRCGGGDGKIPYEGPYDYILCVATLAHVLDDNILSSLLDEFNAKLNPNGKIFIAEQCGPWEQHYKYAIRRKRETYIQLFEKHRFRLIKDVIYSRKIFTYFDYAVRLVYRTGQFFKKLAGMHVNQNLNYSKFYVALSKKLFTATETIDAHITGKRGVRFFIFEKSE